MIMILRHILTSILFSLLLTSIVLGISFFAFPLDDWSLLLEKRLFDIPYWIVMLTIPVIIGIIVGATISSYWRQRLRFLDRQLIELNKGQQIDTEDEQYKELTKIQQTIEQLQNKLYKQTELSQKLATERAEEREKSLQDVVVQERNRLARELHDSVSQQLFAASMMMSAINEASPPEDETFKKKLSMVEKMIHQSQLEMRALLLHLRPVALKGKSLREGAEELLIELQQKVTIEIDWELEPIQTSKGIEDQLFRILQESISNTLRHAKATSINVLLIERDHYIILRIVDDGAGFDLEEVRPSAYGLQNMKERAYEVGGTFKIVSLPNEGTRLEVKVPQIKKEVIEDD